MIRIVKLISLFISLSVSADSWMPPHDFEVSSDDGQYIATIIPAEDNKPGQIKVSSAKPNQEIWNAKLVNSVAPTQAFVSDDGESVVTLNNWGRVGYGDDVSVIYGRKGLLAKYSLEQMAPPPKPKPDSIAAISDHFAYEGKFSHSTSSRHWNEKSIQFFVREDNQWLFSLWLEWDNRWICWQTQHGHLLKTTSEHTKRWNTIGRQRALKDLQEQKHPYAAIEFLGKLRTQEDRRLIEAWLSDTNFSSGSLQSSSSGNSTSTFAFTSRSDKRKTADRILARWDKLLKTEEDRWSDDYYVLSTIKGSLRLPSKPKKSEGSIRVYLIPENVPLAKWDSRQPDQYLNASLEWSYPYEGKLDSVVDFIIYGIAPGKYHFKVVWDKSAPFCSSDEVLCHPGIGDYVSTSSPLIQATRGNTFEKIRLDCLQPIE